MNSHNHSIKRAVTFVLAALLLFFCFNLSRAQPVMLVKDIDPGLGDGVASIRPPAVVNGTLFFVGNDGTTGNELWRSDGTTGGTVLVKDIPPVTFTSDPQDLTAVNGTLFFVADDTHGRELWKSDGTTAGTVLVKDIYPGPSPFPFPDDLTSVNGMLFFTATVPSIGTELWKSDGTTAGTVIVKDIRPGMSSSTPTDLTDVNGTLFFRVLGTGGWSQLWKSDGTTEGTVLVKAFDDDVQRFTLTDVNGTLFFSAYDSTNGYELWKSDGTAAGTVLVRDINPGAADSDPRDLTNVNGTLFFSADDGTNGHELWKSDGTAAGTVLVKDINPGTSSSGPIGFTNVNGTLFFAAADSATGYELWKSDGTAAGTILVKDINPGSGSAFKNNNLWIGSSPPNNFRNINGTFYFGADDGIHGRELWKSDGTTAGTVLVEDIYPGSTSSRLNNLIVVAGILLFAADDGVIGMELWALRTPITTTLNPVNPPIQIPPSGGSFNFDATLANISGRSETRDVWNLITAPNGNTFTTIGPATLTLPSGFSGMKTLSQQIPGGAPAGQYTYALNVGAFPDTIESSDSFTFTKSVSPTTLQKSEQIDTQDWTVLDMQTGQPVNFADWNAVAIETATEDAPGPEEFILQQNYPNPFNPSTTISFSLPEASEVTLAIYNLRGQLVRTLHSAPITAGHHRLAWDGRDSLGVKVASGIYLYRLEAQSPSAGSARNFVASRKLVLVQ